MKVTEFSFIGLYHYLVAGCRRSDFASSAWIGPPPPSPRHRVHVDLEEGAGTSGPGGNGCLVDKFYGLDARPLPERSLRRRGVRRIALAPASLAAADLDRRLLRRRAKLVTRCGSRQRTVGSHITAWAGAGSATSVYHGRSAALPPWAGRPGLPAQMTAPAGICHRRAVPPGGRRSGPDSALLPHDRHPRHARGPLAAWLNAVHAGTMPADTPLPAGIRFWVD
jgi:hypothetical protein